MSEQTTQTPFDRLTHRKRRMRAASTQKDHGFLFQEIADRLADRLMDINRRFPIALDLGGRTGAIANAVAPLQKIDWLCHSDLAEAMVKGARFPDSLTAAPLVQDEEWLAIKPHSMDLILSNLTLHWTNDLPGALIQIRHALKADGLFLATVFGGDTLFELRECLTDAEVNLTGGLSPRFSPLIDIRDAGALLQRAGFNLPVTDAERLTFLYETPFHLFRELRGMGETNVLNARTRYNPRRALFVEAARLYQDRYGTEEGRIPATFDVLTLTAWTPHESQQKPLSPGSGQTDLRDLLTE